MLKASLQQPKVRRSEGDVGWNPHEDQSPNFGGSKAGEPGVVEVARLERGP
jgi:hypothetical protein